MSNAIDIRLKPYLQPFEQQLAQLEIEALTETTVQLKEDAAGHVWARVEAVHATRAKHKLAYWDLFGGASDGITDQGLRESSAVMVRNGIPLTALRDMLTCARSNFIPARRVLRYGLHGIHEYRGKFFPQLVVALCNIAGVKKGQTLLDPMCGSGTALLEGASAGLNVYGLDLNPLSVLISSTKLRGLRIRPEALAREYERVRTAILGLATPHSHRQDGWLAKLPAGDRKYLSRWFAPSVLLELDEVMSVVQSVRERAIRDLFLVAVSNVLRRLSFQKEADLRVRRETKVESDLDTYREFLEELGRSVRLVLAFLWSNGSISVHRTRVALADVRDGLRSLRRSNEPVDLVVTSPPYATALPYLDTDRLSLTYLGLLSRSEQRLLDQSMIGNREISAGVKKRLEAELAHSKDRLPERITQLIHRVSKLNQQGSAGFRRKNLPALLGKYFLDMRRVTDELHRVLRRDRYCFMVVGRNHTIAGGERVEIATDELLCEIAEMSGFKIKQSLPMEMLVSRDIFRANASSAETTLFLYKP